MQDALICAPSVRYFREALLAVLPANRYYSSHSGGTAHPCASGSAKTLVAVRGATPLAAFAGERRVSDGQWERHAGCVGSQNLLRALDVSAVVLLEGVHVCLHLINLLRRHLQSRRQLPQRAEFGIPLLQVADDELRC